MKWSARHQRSISWSDTNKIKHYDLRMQITIPTKLPLNMHENKLTFHFKYQTKWKLLPTWILLLVIMIYGEKIEWNESFQRISVKVTIYDSNSRLYHFNWSKRRFNETINCFISNTVVKSHEVLLWTCQI